MGYMKCNVERLIRALVGAELAAERRTANEAVDHRNGRYVVTVSRNYGAQGKETAQLLADRLGVRCCDRSILQEVASRAHVDVDLVRRLDEHVKQIKGDWWHALVDTGRFSREQYFHHLVKVILGISRTGGVIVGRGAHLILRPDMAFRVRIVGTLPRCAERIAERENIGPQAARDRVLSVDRERSDYIRELYGVDAGDASYYDLVMNSDRFSVEDMVNIILSCMRRAGYILPEGVVVD